MNRTLESFERGSSDHPLLEATIGRGFEEAVATWAEREALVVSHQSGGPTESLRQKLMRLLPGS